MQHVQRLVINPDTYILITTQLREAVKMKVAEPVMDVRVIRCKSLTVYFVSISYKRKEQPLQLGPIHSKQHFTYSYSHILGPYL